MEGKAALSRLFVVDGHSHATHADEVSRAKRRQLCFQQPCASKRAPNSTILLLHHWNKYTLVTPQTTIREASFATYNRTSRPLLKLHEHADFLHQAFPARTRSDRAKKELHAHHKEQSWHTAERRAAEWCSSVTSHTVSTPRLRPLATATDN
jgi:hypothetical protein